MHKVYKRSLSDSLRERINNEARWTRKVFGVSIPVCLFLTRYSAEIWYKCLMLCEISSMVFGGH